MNQSDTASKQDTLVFAIGPGVPVDLEQLAEAAIQLQDLLSSLTGMSVKVVPGENYEETLAGLESGTIDAAKLGPYAFAQAQARFGAQALVKAVDTITDGAAPTLPYRSIIFTRADSGITHLSQLKGQRFGFVDQHSTTGYLMATFLLEQAGLDPARDIEPVFLHSHPAVAEAVITGKVAAGAIMEARFMSALAEVGPEILRLLAMSPLLSRGPIVVRPDLPHHIKRKLQHALVQKHQSPHDALRLLKLPTQHFVVATTRERSLKTVAELAGVSYATVSRAISGGGRISPATTARILKLVDELGYRPNADARGLHKARGELIGLLLPSLQYPDLDSIIAGIQEVLKEVHMQLLICPAGPGEQQKAYFEMFSNSRFEGILLTQRNILDPAALEVLVRNGRPYMLLEQALLDEGFKVAREWFVRQGHRCVGLLAGPASLLEPTTVYQAAHNLSGEQFRYSEIPADPDAWGSLLSQQVETPSAFLCTDNQTALRLRELLHGSGIAAPVLGLGNSPLAQWARLPVLAFDGRKLGQSVTLRLLKMLNVPTPAQQEGVCFRVETYGL